MLNAQPGRESGAGFVPASSLVLDNGAIPLTWWATKPNVGDLLSPYLVQRMTGLPVTLVDNRPRRSSLKRRLSSIVASDRFSYLAVGSILNRARKASVVWGTGAFGVEGTGSVERDARYLAVRGPLTRNLLRIHGVDCPPVYGDPALLLPMVFRPPVEKRYPIGLVLRHSETAWLSTAADKGIEVIDMGSSDVEKVLLQILACERIATTSLHGLVLADAYGIPSAWLASTSPNGLEFKFYDYFLSVDKVRSPQGVTFDGPHLGISQLDSLEYDDRALHFDHESLLAACPFVDSWVPLSLPTLDPARS
jgi:hypothetical protein